MLCNNNRLRSIAKLREGIFQKALIVQILLSVVLKNHSTLQYHLPVKAAELSPST